MSAEPYAPSETELANCYAHVLEDRAGENYNQAKADAERGIAAIKADAIREAHVHIGENLIRGGNIFAAMLDYADQIEEEAWA